MTTHDALLAAVIANHNEDTPRLVMADWFDENDQPERAELIRLQVHLSATTRECSAPTTAYHHHQTYTNDCRRCEVCSAKRRETELLATGGFAWLPSALMSVESNSASRACLYRRGFVEQVKCRAEPWIRHGDNILTQIPLAKVVLTTIPEIRHLVPEMKFVHFLGDDNAYFNSDDDFGTNQRHDVSSTYHLLSLLQLRWPRPGLVFELPEVDEGFANYADSIQRIIPGTLPVALQHPQHVLGATVQFRHGLQTEPQFATCLRVS